MTDQPAEQDGEEHFLCLVCSRMFRSEAMFRKHQLQAHRSIPDSDTSDDKVGVTLEEGQSEGDMEQPLLDPSMATYYRVVHLVEDNLFVDIEIRALL